MVVELHFLLALLAFTGCHQNGEPPRSGTFGLARKSAATSLDSIAESYVRLALALGERNADSLDFSTAREEIRAEVHRSYPSLDEIDGEAVKCRRNFILSMCPWVSVNVRSFLSCSLPRS